jgi:4-nitrophenyl phosphatase
VLDLDGCLYLEGAAIPGARSTLKSLQDAGFRLVIATNNSTRHRSTVAERVERIVGFTIPVERVVTSGLAVVGMIGRRHRPVLVVGEGGLVATLAEAGIAMTEEPREARAVIVGLDRSFDYDRLRRAAAAIRHGASFIATNGDATFPTAGVPEPGAGAIVAAVERAGGAAPVFAGKPYDPMRRAIEARLGPGPTWMVGDRLDTDIALGKLAGWTTVLVMTGVTEAGSDIPDHLRPDHILASVAGLDELITTTEAHAR